MLTFIWQDKPEESGILEHIQAEAPKEIIYQLGQLDTILFWPELKQNTPQAPRLQSQQTRPRATGALSQDLHHPPPNCMLFTKAVWLQAPLCMASSGSLANRDGGEREEQAARHAEARLATSKGCERESDTRITNTLLQFNHSWETHSQHWVRCLDSVKVKDLGTQDTSLNWTFDSIWKQGCRGFRRS